MSTSPPSAPLPPAPKRSSIGPGLLFSLRPSNRCAQRLAYRILAACWSLEEGGQDAARDIAHFSDADLGIARHALTDISRALRTGVRPVLPSGLPALLRDDLRALVDSLVLFA